MYQSVAEGKATSEQSSSSSGLTHATSSAGVMPNEFEEQPAPTLVKTSDFEPVATRQQYLMNQRRLRDKVRVMFQERDVYHTRISYNSRTKTTADRTFSGTQQVRSDVYRDIETLTGKKTSILGLTVSRLQVSL